MKMSAVTSVKSMRLWRPARRLLVTVTLLLPVMPTVAVAGDGERDDLARVHEGRSPECREVVVGITPNCPYGMKGCWPNISASLERVSLVKRIGDVDYYNCTATVLMKEPGLPDVAKFRDQFTALVGGNYTLRGIEITLQGTLEMKDGSLHLTAERPAVSIPLAKLEHKLQWNHQKQRARGPEDEERTAYQELLDKVTAAGARGTKVKASVTGPLHTAAPGSAPVLEVREYVEL